MKSRKKSALITIEAALVLPVFMLALYFFLYFYQVMAIQETFSMSATNIAQEVSSYGPLFNLLMKYEKDSSESVIDDAATHKDSLLGNVFSDIDTSLITGMIIDDLYLQHRLHTELGDNSMIKRCVEGGFDGISLIGSSIFDEDECITITLTYKLRLPLFDSMIPSLPVIQTVRMRSFNGYAVASKAVANEGEQDTKEEIVYVTENASVYHTNGNCTHLKLSTRGISSSILDKARNKSGGLYQKCEKCFQAGDPIPGIVFITDQGNRFHKNTACSALKRTILEVPLSEVSHLSICKRCQSYQKK